jgi:signal transduction histidine kinase/DNA-binding response OmpR family regulator
VTDPDDTIGYGRDILVVDDSQSNLIAIEAALAPLDRHLVLARSGPEALRHLLKQDFALIIMDVQMPGMDGFETAQLMRSRERYRSTPIIFVTGISWPEETDLRGYELGAFDFMMKPIRPEVLRAKATVFIRLQERTIELQRKSEELRQAQARDHERELQRATTLERGKLAALFAQAPAAICVLTGPDHVFTLANSAYLQLVGKRELVGKPIRAAIPELEGQAFYEKLDRVYTTGEAISGDQVAQLARGPEGELDDCYFSFIYQPFRDARGLVEGIMVFAFEVTVQVRARRQAEALSARVLASEDALRASEAEARAANRAKDEFLAMLGHELRNPLAPIVTALELMRLQQPAAASRERAVIERQVTHLVRLVDDLLDVSRITGGKIELDLAICELADVVSRAVEIASPLLEKKYQQLTVDVAPGLAVNGDEMRLAQAIANVITNAAKFTEPRGSIAVEGRRVDGKVKLRIRDSGIGISPEMLPHVFELFAQERQAADRAQGGLGLGLAIVKSIVGMHGGTIVANSEGTGRGSEFVIELPAASGHPAVLPTDTARLRAQRVRLLPSELRKVLVVDDNQDACEILADALRSRGHDVRIAFDGPSALQLVRQFVPDVAVLDIGLPVMDGYELAGKLRTQLSPNEPRMIALTGYGQSSDRKRAEAAGFDLHLVKPIDVDRIQEGIKRVMNGHPGTT